MNDTSMDNIFWGSVKKHEILLKKCFFYLFKKYPNHDGIDDAYNILLVQMHHLKVFQRFDVDRPKNLDLDKAFQQFVYKWVEKILGDTYRAKAKHRKRYTTMDRVEDVTPVTYKTLINVNDTSFAKAEDFDNEGHVKAPVRKDYPSINDIGEYVGEKGFNAQDELEACDLVVKIKKVLKGDLEKKIFGLREQYGLSVNDIATMLGYTPQNISLILNKIKKRCADKGLINAKPYKKSKTVHEEV